MVDERVCGFVDCGGKMGAYPLLRVWPEIKYLFQGGMSGKGSLLAKTSEPIRYLIRMKYSVLGLHDYRRHFLMWGVWHMFQARNLAGIGEAPTISGSSFWWESQPALPIKLPGMVYHPTAIVFCVMPNPHLKNVCETFQNKSDQFPTWKSLQKYWIKFSPTESKNTSKWSSIMIK